LSYVSDYNPDWPEWFCRIAGYLRPRIANCLRIEHVGSTSIPGMVAKPIIDVDVVVEDGGMRGAVKSIEEAGYGHQGDLGVAGREAFKAVSSLALALPAHHLYACESSSIELRKHLSFREYLIAHPSESSRLAALKQHLAFDLHLTRSEYISAKALVVEEISNDALEWYLASMLK
jgi:GrpB-like predicted nucleotidyltransferase (UPF0157 family)